MKISAPWESQAGRRVAAEYGPHGDVQARWQAAVLAALRAAGTIPGAATRLAVSRRTAQRWVYWLRDHRLLAGVTLPRAADSLRRWRANGRHVGHPAPM